jgi:hypothetical protein
MICVLITIPLPWPWDSKGVQLEMSLVLLGDVLPHDSDLNEHCFLHHMHLLIPEYVNEHEFSKEIYDKVGKKTSFRDPLPGFISSSSIYWHF